MKQLSIISLLAAALILTSCSARTNISRCGDILCHGDTYTAITADAGVRSVHVSHALSGHFSEFDAVGGELNALTEWLDGLLLTRVTFDDGASPADNDGGEAFWFESEDGSFPEFSYIISGPDIHYVAKDGEWYRVHNPSPPPVGDKK